MAEAPVEMPDIKDAKRNSKEKGRDENQQKRRGEAKEPSSPSSTDHCSLSVSCLLPDYTYLYLYSLELFATYLSYDGSGLYLGCTVPNQRSDLEGFG